MMRDEQRRVFRKRRKKTKNGEEKKVKFHDDDAGH